jgi:DNA-nicking Smr family endonuclease
MGNKSFIIHPFEKLRKRIESKQAVPPPPARRKKKEEYTDEELFGREMEDVLVIEEFRSLACASRSRKPKGEPVQRDSEREVLAVLGEITAGERPIHLPDTQEYVEWINPAFRDDIIRSLHEGRFSVQAFLDLHGCTVPEAEEEFDDFIRDSLRKSLSCVKVIHGRGLRSVRGARLKDAVVTRLSGHFRKSIIAYVTARQCDGGLGALYILLGKK